jgi:hypothetical protein
MLFGSIILLLRRWCLLGQNRANSSETLINEMATDLGVWTLENQTPASTRCLRVLRGAYRVATSDAGAGGIGGGGGGLGG